jgi:hypothetical protein
LSPTDPEWVTFRIDVLGNVDHLVGITRFLGEVHPV